MKLEVSRRGLLAAAMAPSPTPSWPVFDQTEENAILDTLRSGKWSRSYGGRRAEEFEKRYAELTGAKFCLATANGTSALIAALNAVGAGPGDAVVLSPYTFVATLNVVLLQHALPVFSDTDIESFQMDVPSLEKRAPQETVAVIPVHIGGAPVDLDALLPVARKHNWKVIEDACQAHLGEWRGRKLGSLGDCGCFSFQASKNLNSGEGGALITSDEGLMDRAYAFHGNGRSRKADASGFAYVSNGANLRLTEFQSALLISQMTRVQEQSRRREQNAQYLSSMLAKIPGIRPAKLHAGCTRNAWHLYMFRCTPDAGLPRERFLRGLSAQGVHASGGYSPLNKEPFLERVVMSRHYQRIYGEKRLKEWRERNVCPVNDRLCQEAVWLTQTELLRPRADMERIAEAVDKARKG